jgi:hypothetical protein
MCAPPRCSRWTGRWPAERITPARENFRSVRHRWRGRARRRHALLAPAASNWAVSSPPGGTKKFCARCLGSARMPSSTLRLRRGDYASVRAWPDCCGSAALAILGGGFPPFSPRMEVFNQALAHAASGRLRIETERVLLTEAWQRAPQVGSYPVTDCRQPERSNAPGTSSSAMRNSVTLVRSVALSSFVSPLIFGSTDLTCR